MESSITILTNQKKPFRYSRETFDVEVSVEAQYRPDQSSPVDAFYYFTYRVQIWNKRDEKVQLRRRHWLIRNGDGRLEEVAGEGVIGQQPIILPQRKFTYTSACPLDTSRGEMFGRYEMWSKKLGSFEVEIPKFYLGRPNHLRLVKS